MIQDSRYGAVEVQQLFKISPALNVYVKGACSGECTGESLLHIFNASCAFARVVTNTVEDQTLDAIPAQCTSNTVSGVYIRTNVDQFLQYARGLTEVTF